MTYMSSYFSNEQRRYIRRSGLCSTFRPEQIFPMIDFVCHQYQLERQKTSFPNKTAYMADMHYILSCFPVLEVHSYMAKVDAGLIKTLYSALDCAWETDYSNMTATKTQRRKHQLIKNFKSIIEAQMVLCS